MLVFDECIEACVAPLRAPRSASVFEALDCTLATEVLALDAIGLVLVGAGVAPFSASTLEPSDEERPEVVGLYWELLLPSAVFLPLIAAR